LLAKSSEISKTKTKTFLSMPRFFSQDQTKTKIILGPRGLQITAVMLVSCSWRK